MTDIVANSKFDFNSDVVNIIVLVYDCSGSMYDDIYAIKSANVAFKKDFSKFEEKKAIAISKCCFAENISMSGFLPVEHFNTNYQAYGGTSLYATIRYSANITIEYYQELVKRLNIRPRITYLVFSDGIDSYDSSSEYRDAIAAIKNLNSLDATTVFVAFRNAIESDIGTKLGFTCTRNISSVQELISCLGTELSQSCKEQSRSAVSLKSAFFSKAATATNVTPDDSDTLSDDFFSI